MDDTQPTSNPTSHRNQRTLVIVGAIVALVVVIAAVFGVNAYAQRQRQNTQMSPQPYTLTAITMDSANDGWALASYTGSAGSSPKANQASTDILHIHNGVVTKQTTIHAAAALQPVIRAFSSTNIWLLLNGAMNGLYHYDGQLWIQITLPTPADAQSDTESLQYLAMDSPTDGWLTASYTSTQTWSVPGQPSQEPLLIYHYDGHAWQIDAASQTSDFVGTFAAPAGQWTGLSATPNGDVWATTSAGAIYHRSNGSWQKTQYHDERFGALVMTGAVSGWLSAGYYSGNGGPDGTPNSVTQVSMWRWNGATWDTSIPLPAEATISLASATTASGPNDVWMTSGSGSYPGPNYVGSADGLAWQSNMLLRFDGTRWSQAAFPRVSAINPKHNAQVISEVSFPYLSSATANDVWVAGVLVVYHSDSAEAIYAHDFDTYPLIYHYSDGKWQAVPLSQL